MSAALGSHGWVAKRNPSDKAKAVSGWMQSILVTLWCMATSSEAMMAHLDFTLEEQITHHIQYVVVLLLPALLAALIAPTRSHFRFCFQTLAIGATATFAYTATMAFN